MKKLILVSITAGGKTLSVFVKSENEMRNGKTVVSRELVDKLLSNVRVRRGEPYSIS